MPFGQHLPMPSAATPMLGDTLLFVGNVNISGFQSAPLTIGQRQGDKAPRASHKSKQCVNGGRADGALTCPGRAPKEKCRFF